MKGKLKKGLAVCVCAVGIFFAGLALANHALDQNIHYTPGYEKQDLSVYFHQPELAEEDYKALFYQTGLGKAAIDELRQAGGYGEAELRFAQTEFFSPVQTECEKIGIITHQETIVDTDGFPSSGFSLPTVQNGDVLITTSTHSLGWRHGHAAIVTGADKDQCLEAFVLGTDSAFHNINNWRSYPRFVLLRLKDTPQEKRDEIAAFASQHMLGVPYRLTTGIFFPKLQTPPHITGTQCAHLVWNSFANCGFDPASSHGPIVTVADLLRSPLFEVVQVYGVDPANYWGRTGGAMQ